MKAIIESELTRPYNFDSNKVFMNEFDLILSSVITATNGTELRDYITGMNFKYFKCGFGSSHMWVKQLNSFGDPFKDRLLFVEFSN